MNDDRLTRENPVPRFVYDELKANFDKALEALKRSSPVCQQTENGKMWHCPHWDRCETNTGDPADPLCPALDDHRRLIAELEAIQ